MKRRLLRKISSELIPIIEQDGLIFWLDSEISSSYSGSGTNWHDIVGGLDCTIVDGTFNGATKTMNFSALNEYINVPSLNVNPNGGYTFTTFLKITSYNTIGNPGFWRYIDGLNIGSFNVMQYNFGLDGAPWVRINNNDTLKPVSGWVMPLSTYVMISFVITDSSTIKVYENGVEKHSVANAYVQNDFIVNYLNYQFTTDQNMFANYKNFIFYDKPLSSAAVLNNYNDLSSFYTL